jgi:hypothetical protein
MADVRLGLTPGKESAKELAKVRAQATLLHAREREEVRFSELGGKEPLQLRKGEATVTLTQAQTTGAAPARGYSLHFEVEGKLGSAPEANRLGGFEGPEEFTLLDAQGQAARPNSRGRTGLAGRIRYTLGWAQLPEGFQPAVFVYRYVSKVEEEKIEFTYENVPLP